MEKTATLNLRVNPVIKQNAEQVLKQLGIPMATAVDMFLRQVSLTKSIPFKLEVPMAPRDLVFDGKSPDEIKTILQQGVDDIDKGNLISFEEVKKQIEILQNENI